MNGVSEFSTFVPYVLLCPILKQPEIVQENIHIVPKLFSVWPKFCNIHTYLVWLVSVPYCLQILGVLGKKPSSIQRSRYIIGTNNKLVWIWNKIRRNFFTGPRRIV